MRNILVVFADCNGLILQSTFIGEGGGVGGVTLTWHARDAEDVSIADVELVHERARLVGIDDHHFTGRMRAGEDPDTAAHGVGFLQLLGLEGERSVREATSGDHSTHSLYSRYEYQIIKKKTFEVLIQLWYSVQQN